MMTETSDIGMTLAGHTNGVCPFCQTRPATTDDHVFPQFLGGHRTIRACQTCNNCFGHRFEGPSAKDLAPVTVFLSRSGLKPPKTATHKKAWVGPATGYEYDLNSNGLLTVTHPQLTRNADGKVIRIVARNPEEGRRIADSIVRKGLAKGYTAVPNEDAALPLPPVRDWGITIGPELRRLAVKMCVGVARLLVPAAEDVIDPICRAFLFEGTPNQSIVRLMHPRSASLDSLRPPLAHVIYTEGDPERGTCYGIIQIFGIFQLHVQLHASYGGTRFAAMGVLDVRNWREEFVLREGLYLPEPPQYFPVTAYNQWLEEWSNDINLQVEEAFGCAAVTLKPAADQQHLEGKATIPLLWIENTAEIHLEFELAPDRDGRVTIPSDPRKWVFSADFGQTHLPVIETFIERWNSQKLDRTVGCDHHYVADEVRPDVRVLLSEDYWCPIPSLRIRYRVSRQAWLGSVEIDNLSAVLNRSEQTVKTTIDVTSNDIPTKRSTLWASVNDIDAIRGSGENIITVELWHLDKNNCVCGGMTLQES